MTALQRLLSVAPGDVDARVRLGELHVRSGSTFAAIAELRRAFEALEQVSRPGDQRRVLSMLEQLQPDDPEVAKDVARAALLSGAPKEALAKLQPAYLKTPNDPELLQLLARTFQELGEKEKTLGTLRTLASIQRGAPQQRTLQLIERLSNPAAARQAQAAGAKTPPKGTPPVAAVALPAAVPPVAAIPAQVVDTAIDLDLDDLDEDEAPETVAPAEPAIEEVGAGAAATGKPLPPPVAAFLPDLLPELPDLFSGTLGETTSKIALEPEAAAAEPDATTPVDDLPLLPAMALELQLRDNTAPIALPVASTPDEAEAEPAALPFFPPMPELPAVDDAAPAAILVEATRAPDEMQVPPAGPSPAGPSPAQSEPATGVTTGGLVGLEHPAIRTTRRVGFL